MDFGALARQMTNLIDENVSERYQFSSNLLLKMLAPLTRSWPSIKVVDKELKEWILPDFSTTRENDTVVSSVLMMATLKA